MLVIGQVVMNVKECQGYSSERNRLIGSPHGTYINLNYHYLFSFKSKSKAKVIYCIMDSITLYMLYISKYY